MKKYLSNIRTILLAGVISLVAAMPVSAEPLKLTILHFNDFDRMDGVKGAGGAAKIAAVVNKERARAEAAGGKSLVTFGGDLISPSLLSGIDKGKHIIDLMNKIGVDIATLGNHEFDFGPDILKERISEAKFAYLAGNIDYKGKPGFPGATQTKMVDFGEYKIGFLGLTTPATAYISSAGSDVSFRDPSVTANALAKQLRDAGADMVIATTHMEYGEDLEVLRNVRGVDIVVGGHDHLGFTWFNGKQMVFKSGTQGVFVGVLDLVIERVKGRRGPKLVWTPSMELRQTKWVEGDPALAAAVKGYSDKLDEALNVEIGTSTTELDSRRSSVRSEETAIGNLITDAMREATGADIAMTNGGGIRGDRTYDAGVKLTRKDILAELPFGNTSVKLEVSGKTLMAALENGVSRVEKGAGRFAQISGATLVYDLSKEPGSRVVKAEIGGKPIDPGKTYTVATNDFLARGGDAYSMFKSAKNLIDAASARLMATQVIDYISAKGTVSPKVEGRITRK